MKNTPKLKEESLNTYTELNDVIKIEQHIDIAKKFNESFHLEQEYGITHIEYEKLQNYWDDVINKKLSKINNTETAVFELLEKSKIYNQSNQLKAEWAQYFTSFFRLKRFDLEENTSTN